MILRMCAVKKLACRTALYVCVTNLNEFKSLKGSFLEYFSLILPHQGVQNMGQLCLEVFKHYVLSRPPYCVHAVYDVIRTSASEHTSDVSRRGSVVDP